MVISMASRRDKHGGVKTYSQGTLQGNVVLLDTCDGLVGNGGLAILQNGGDIDGLPLDRGL